MVSVVLWHILWQKQFQVAKIAVVTAAALSIRISLVICVNFNLNIFFHSFLWMRSRREIQKKFIFSHSQFTCNTLSILQQFHNIMQWTMFQRQIHFSIPQSQLCFFATIFLLSFCKCMEHGSFFRNFMYSHVRCIRCVVSVSLILWS